MVVLGTSFCPACPSSCSNAPFRPWLASQGVFEPTRRDERREPIPAALRCSGVLGSKGLRLTGVFLGQGKLQEGRGDARETGPWRLAQAVFSPLPSPISNSPTSFSSKTLPTRPLIQHSVQCLLPPLSPAVVVPGQPFPGGPSRPGTGPLLCCQLVPTTNLPATMARVPLTPAEVHQHLGCLKNRNEA